MTTLPARHITDRSALTRTLHRYPLTAFFTLAYAGSWIAWLPMVLAGNNLLPAPAAISPGLRFVLTVLAPFAGPSLAAFVITAALQGRGGVGILLGRYVQWRFGLSWYLVALAGPLLVLMLAVAAACGTVALPPLGEQRRDLWVGVAHGVAWRRAGGGARRRPPERSYADLHRAQHAALLMNSQNMLAQFGAYKEIEAGVARLLAGQAPASAASLSLPRLYLVIDIVLAGSLALALWPLLRIRRWERHLRQRQAAGRPYGWWVGLRLSWDLGVALALLGGVRLLLHLLGAQSWVEGFSLFPDLGVWLWAFSGVMLLTGITRLVLLRQSNIRRDREAASASMPHARG